MHCLNVVDKNSILFPNSTNPNSAPGKTTANPNDKTNKDAALNPPIGSLSKSQPVAPSAR